MTKRIPTFRSLGLVTPARSRRCAYRRSQTATPGLTTSDVGLSLGLAYARVMHTAPGLLPFFSSVLNSMTNWVRIRVIKWIYGCCYFMEITATHTCPSRWHTTANANECILTTMAANMKYNFLTHMIDGRVALMRQINNIQKESNRITHGL